jgi:hypothetical protein
MPERWTRACDLCRDVRFDIAASPRLEKFFDISNAVNVNDWSLVGSAVGLRWLGFEDVGTLNSIQFVERLIHLESLFITGACRIKDGRVAFLGAHPSLRKVRIARSAKNDATYEDVEKELRRRPRQPGA